MKRSLLGVGWDETGEPKPGASFIGQSVLTVFLYLLVTVFYGIGNTYYIIRIHAAYHITTYPIIYSPKQVPPHVYHNKFSMS